MSFAAINVPNQEFVKNVEATVRDGHRRFDVYLVSGIR